jgi:general secretion pathway protein E
MDGATAAPGSPRLPFAFARRRGIVEDPSAAAGSPARLLARTATDDAVWREVRRALGCAVEIVPCSDEVFEQALSQTYRDRGGSESQTESDALLFELDDDRAHGPRDLLEDETDAPVIRLVNRLLRQALQMRASDMHIEPLEEALRVRFRVDGVLRTALERTDVPVRRVISRFKVMAGLDIAERRLPQDGRIALRLGGRRVDVRISSLPAQHGERLVLRLLDRSAGMLTLDQIGLSPDQRAALDRMIAATNGIILATGPTGSGKTTTLYTLLQRLNDTERNILTVEDPVEYELPGVGQSQVNTAIGMGFAESLRAILRQDPDVILVGEIRDTETARIAVRAAMTGHLVLSTLHTNTAAGAVARLVDLGVEPFLIASTLRGVVAQRLVRRLCAVCSTRRTPTAAEAATFARAGLAAPEAVGEAGPGCEACGGTGYVGRKGVYEVIEIGGELAAMIHEGVDERVFERRARPPESAILAAALGCVASGETSLPEALRVISETA